MVTALYRRYRPDTFDEVIGQEHVTAPLMAALGNGRINHAYLFSGPRGCGKTTSARILARCLNCAQGPTPKPCGQCESCRDLATGGPGSLDVVEIDAASHNGVDDARDLRERAIYAPARDRYKVFILDEAHMVTPQGFNALLKLVEEPPEHVKFIFATTEPEKVIGTIRSRTHHYPFRLVPPEVLTTYLSDLCQRESVPVGKGVLPLVVRAGGGSVRDTLSVLDQLMAGATAEGIDYHRAIALLGYTPESLLADIVDAFCAGDGAAVFRAVERVVESGQDPRRFVEDLLERFRDLIIVGTAPHQAQAFMPEAPVDLLEKLVTQAQQYGPAELSRGADILNAGLSEMTGATSPRLQLELICARILLPAVDSGRQAVLSRIERMERRAGMSASGQVPTAAGHSAAQALGSTAGHTAPAQLDANEPERESVPQREGSLDDFENDYADFARSAEEFAGAEAEASGETLARGTGLSSERDAAQLTEPSPAHSSAPEQPQCGDGTSPHTDPEAQHSVPEPAVRQPQEQQSAGPALGGEEIDAIRRAWPTILDAVGQKSRLVRAILAGNAVPSAFEDGQLTLGFSNQGALGSFARPGNDVRLSEAIAEVLGIRAGISLGEVGVDTATPNGRQPAQPAPSRPRPSREEVDAVVGPRAMDQEPVDRNRYWTRPDQGEGEPPSRASRTESEGRETGPAEDEPEPASDGRRVVDPFSDEYRGPQHTPNPAQAADDPETSAGSGAVDAPDLVIPPPLEDEPDDAASVQVTRETVDSAATESQARTQVSADGPPAADDDLDFLGVYRDADFSLEPDSGSTEQAAPAAANPFAHLAERDSASAAADQRDEAPAHDSWGHMGETTWGQEPNPARSAQTDGGAPAPAGASAGSKAQSDGGEEYPDFDADDDLDMTDAPEFGIPVVERLLGGVVIEEFEE